MCCAIHRSETASSTQDRNTVSHDMPFRMTARALQNITAVRLMPQPSQLFCNSLTFFTGYQYLHSLTPYTPRSNVPMHLLPRYNGTSSPHRPRLFSFLHMYHIRLTVQSSNRRQRGIFHFLFRSMLLHPIRTANSLFSQPFDFHLFFFSPFQLVLKLLCAAKRKLPFSIYVFLRRSMCFTPSNEICLLQIK